MNPLYQHQKIQTFREMQTKNPVLHDYPPNRKAITKIRRYKTVAKIWGNSKSPTQLVGVHISATTLENCLALTSTVEHICTL